MELLLLPVLALLFWHAQEVAGKRAELACAAEIAGGSDKAVYDLIMLGYTAAEATAMRDRVRSTLELA